MRLLQLHHQGLRGDEHDAAVGFGGRAAETDREMGLADSRRSQQQHVFATSDPTRRRPDADLVRVDGRLCCELKVVEDPEHWKACLFQVTQ